MTILRLSSTMLGGSDYGEIQQFGRKNADISEALGAKIFVDDLFNVGVCSLLLFLDLIVASRVTFSPEQGSRIDEKSRSSDCSAE